MCEDLTVCYAVTPDARYRRMAAASIYTVVRHNPGARIRVTEVDGGHYPYGIKPKALSPTARGWVLYLDADTRINGDLAALLDGAEAFNARVATAWSQGRIHRPAWAAICEHFGFGCLPVLNSGAFLCQSAVARALAIRWSDCMAAIRESGLEDPLRLKRPEWWMLDQFSLTVAVAEAVPSVRYWGSEQHSFAWRGEAPGLIHHYGTKRWKDPLA